MHMIDITVPIRPGMPIYEADPALLIEQVQSMASGAICNVRRMELGVHTGTHIDAPVHFIDGAAGAEATPLDALIGDAFVVDATNIESDIDARVLRRLDVPSGIERLLFKTPNSGLWSQTGFSSSFFGITGDAAEELVARGVRLAGIDYLSIAPMADPVPAHVALLRAGVVILEGLDLREVEPGPYELICLPLLIPGSDGAPARALLRRR